MTTLRVFLSSTSVDLAAYRARVASLVEALGLFAVRMDRFPVRPEADATTASLDELRTSDLYILLLAWRYGDIPDGHTLSVTHQEYREARARGMPCFVFVADPSADKTDQPFPAQDRDAEHHEHLVAFHQEVQQHLAGYFESIEDLANQVSATLNRYLLGRGLPGRLPRDLPPKVPGFVGRVEELERLLATLRQGQSKGLSALVAAPGGVGKSALASEVLHRLAADPAAYPGGITWVRCDWRTDLEGLSWVYDQVLAAWGVPLPPEALRGVATPEAEVAVREQALRDRLHLPGPGLVLLDNVEPGLPLGRALEHLTPRRLTLLLTSRQRLNLPGQRLLDLAVLEPDPAVQLFCERYRDRDGTWDAERDEPAARAVVDRLGGLPLAIELAAAWAAHGGAGVAGLAAELEQPEVLAQLQDPLVSDAMVRYSLERSLTLLSPLQRVRFAALGLPDGPDWPRPVVEALLAAVPPPEAPDASDVVDTEQSVAAPEGATAGQDLDRMAALSLVTLVPAAPQGEGEGVGRVRLHPLLRTLAAQEWDRQPVTLRRAGVEGLVAGVVAWAEAHQKRDMATYVVIEAEEALVVGALRQADAAEVAPRAVVDTALALQGYLQHGGRARVGVELWQRAAEAARQTGDRPSEGACRLGLGNRYQAWGAPELARGSYEQALTIAQVMDDIQTASAALAGLGQLAWQRGAAAEARRLYEEALALQRQQDDRIGQGHTLTSLGILAFEQGDHAQARRALEQALGIFWAEGNRGAQATILRNLGELALADGDLALAHGWLDQALPLARAAGSHRAECALLLQQADLARREQRWADAGRHVEAAWTLSQTLGSREWEANVLSQAARLLRDQGRREAARQAFTEALAHFEAIGQRERYQARAVHTELATLDSPPPVPTPRR